MRNAEFLRFHFSIETIPNPYRQNCFCRCTNKLPSHTHITFTYAYGTRIIHCLYLVIQQWLINPHIHIHLDHHHYNIIITTTITTVRFTNPCPQFLAKNTLFVLKLITYSASIILPLVWLNTYYIYIYISHHSTSHTHTHKHSKHLTHTSNHATTFLYPLLQLYHTLQASRTHQRITSTHTRLLIFRAFFVRI